MEANGKVIIREAKEQDRSHVIRIFNYYIEHGFAAFPEKPVPPEFFDLFSSGAYAILVAEQDRTVIGFAGIRPFLPFPAFNRTASVTYFIDPAHTGKGIGSRFLEWLVQEGKKHDIHVLLAQISSRNTPSLEFHRSRGFMEAGCIREAGIKHGCCFDLVFMQRNIS
ncbi:MAG: N-acetyltransferase family protein [Methanoregulaceae archaeon]|nr:N-acetyltransferase family protein [Methanoregulaceae archaeon]